VLSDAMRPRYRSGEFAIVAPGIKPQAGDEVIVFCADGRELLRELRECGGGRVQFAAINGGALETLQRDEITSIELIVGRATRGALSGIPAQQ
jgi:phage repressor protein C with HTH and peptisase S24 domain